MTSTASMEAIGRYAYVATSASTTSAYALDASIRALSPMVVPTVQTAAAGSLPWSIALSWSR